MKRPIILLLIVLLMITMIGCSSKEENELVGTWIDKDNDTLTIKSNGEYESTHYYDKEGTWEVEEDIIIFKSNFNELTKKYIIEKENDKAYLSFDETDIFGNKKDRQFIRQNKK